VILADVLDVSVREHNVAEQLTTQRLDRRQLTKDLLRGGWVAAQLLDQRSLDIVGELAFFGPKVERAETYSPAKWPDLAPFSRGSLGKWFDGASDFRPSKNPSKSIGWLAAR
jgi:hypothetical protein